jgi:hypothetical protein
MAVLGETCSGRKEKTAMRRGLFLVVAAPLALAACSDLSSTQQRTLSGGAIGTAGGAVLGALGGNAILGAVAGAGAGALGGYLYDQNEKSKQEYYREGYAAGRHSANR